MAEPPKSRITRRRALASRPLSRPDGPRAHRPWRDRGHACVRRGLPRAAPHRLPVDPLHLLVSPAAAAPRRRRRGSLDAGHRHLRRPWWRPADDDAAGPVVPARRVARGLLGRRARRQRRRAGDAPRTIAGASAWAVHGGRGGQPGAWQRGSARLSGTEHRTPGRRSARMARVSGENCMASDAFLDWSVAVQANTIERFGLAGWSWDPGPGNARFCYATGHGHLPGQGSYRGWRNATEVRRRLKERFPDLFLQAFYGQKEDGPVGASVLRPARGLLGAAGGVGGEHPPRPELGPHERRRRAPAGMVGPELPVPAAQL